MFELRQKRTTIRIDFTPAKALTFQSDEQLLVEYPILPTFNLDRKSYSQAFYNPYDGLGNYSKMKRNHQKRVKELSTMIQSESIVPPPPLR